MAASEEVRFDLLQGADIEDFIASDSSNTKKVIKFGLVVFREFCKVANVTYEELSNQDLDSVLARFYIAAKNKRGEDYSAKSMSSIRFGLQRHFIATKDVDILKSGLSMNHTTEHAQKRLTTDLLNNYGPRTLRPVKNISQPINISLRLLPSELVKFDEVEQVVKLLASVRMVWTDENMIWDPEEYDGIDYVTVTRDDVWLPDMELQENIDKDFISTANTYIEVTHDGKMNWYFPALLTSTCPIDITYFPFDTQVCHMTFVPWTLDNTLVQLNRSHDQDSTFDRYNRNGVWLLAHTVEDVTESGSGKTWSEVRVNLRFRREPGFFFKTIILPSCMLTLLMSLVCWLHPASGEKVTLAVNNLVAMILFQQLVADRIPPSGNSTSIIVNLFLLLIILCCFEVACAVIVLRLYHTGNRKALPEWMRKLMTSRLITPLVSDHARHLFILTSHDEKQSKNHMADQSGDASSESRQHHEFCMTLLKGHQESNREAAQKVSVQPVNGQLAEGGVQQPFDPQGTEVQWREAAIVLDRVLFVVIFILTLATWLYVLSSFIFRTDNKA